MISSKLPQVFYGGDYNPEQFDLQTLTDDIQMLKQANINIATLGVFSWALMQPTEDTFDFSWLDTVIDTLYASGIYTCLATPTAVPPAWMVTRYPDILRVDFEGRQHKFGGRANACPHSPHYRQFSTQIAGELAKRYANHPAVLVWHISNEYAGSCYCDRCEKAFREWLKARYETLDALNRAWNTRFWGHTFTDWDEIVLPSVLTEQRGDRTTNFQGISLDYNRFNSDALLDCFKLERDAIRIHSSNIPITTNLMGTFKTLDYFRWAREMDVISWDNYPAFDTPESVTALRHDLMRGLRDGQPFMLMEQTPSQQNWQPYNALKRPGVMRLWSYQAMAHGADTVMFFQLRRSVGACEKYHGAVIEHVGHTNTRVFREVATLGSELEALGDMLLDARAASKVGILFDWDNWWALEFSSGPTRDLNYLNEVQKYYDAFYRRHIPVDMVAVDADWSTYDVLIAPLLYMVKPGVSARLEQFVKAGGTFVTTYFSGIVNESDLVTQGGYPGELRQLLGIWVEEIDALPPGKTNHIVVDASTSSLSGSYSCSILCDLLHAESAEVIATYGEDFYQGMPVITRNRFGQGQAWYVASSPDDAFLDDFIGTLCETHGLAPAVTAPGCVEVTVRSKGNTSFTFVLNHSPEPQPVDLGTKTYHRLLSNDTVSGKQTIGGREAWILQA